MTAAAQLNRFMARYAPPVTAVARAARARMRKRLPGSVEFVYDNYNALVVGFGPNERPSDAIVSLALYPRWVTAKRRPAVRISAYEVRVVREPPDARPHGRRIRC